MKCLNKNVKNVHLGIIVLQLDYINLYYVPVDIYVINLVLYILLLNHVHLAIIVQKVSKLLLLISHATNLIAPHVLQEISILIMSSILISHQYLILVPTLISAAGISPILSTSLIPHYIIIISLQIFLLLLNNSTLIYSIIMLMDSSLHKYMETQKVY